jgi:Spy/CpxP family protein refolding chaperone
MKRAIFPTTILVLGLLLCGGTPAVEHERGPGGGDQMPKMMERMQKRMRGMHGGMMHRMKGYAHTVLMHAEALKLSDEQLGKIVRIKMRHQKAHQDLMERLHKSMMSAREGMMDPSAEEAGIRKASKEHAEAFKAMIEDAIKERNEVNAVLTPEQRDQLKSLKKEKCAQAKGREAHHPDR